MWVFREFPLFMVTPTEIGEVKGSVGYRLSNEAAMFRFASACGV